MYSLNCRGCDAMEDAADLTGEPKRCNYLPEAVRGENCEEGSESAEHKLL